MEQKAASTPMTQTAAQLWLITEVETTEITEVQTDEVRRGERGSEDVGGSFGSSRVTEQIKTVVRQRVPLDAVALKVQMQGLLQVVGDVFDQASLQSDLQLDEIELAVEINAEGQVSLLGNGGKLADKGAIKLKFKRAGS
jgi:hypothetical protein